MASLIYADLVAETTTTTGTGDITPGGAITGNRSFASVMTTGDQFYYAIDGAPADPNQWEVGIGTFTAGGNIARTPIVSSSGVSAVNLVAGTKTISLTVAAEFYATVQAHDVFAAWEAMPGNSGKSVAEFIDAMLNVNGVAVTMPALSGGGGSAMTGLEFIPPSGMINSAGGDDAVPVRFINTIVKFTNGPVGMETYYDSIVGFGTNVNTNFTRANTASNVGMGAGSIRIESGFIQPGSGISKATEFIIGTFLLDNAERRHMGIYAPVDPAEYITGSIYTLEGGRINLRDGAGNQRVLFDLRPGQSQVFLNGAGGDGHPIVRFQTNNRFAVTQSNAAGTSFLPLPFRNNLNNTQIENGALYVVTGTQATPPGPVAGASFNITSGSDGHRGVAVYCPTIASGNFFAQTWQGSVAGRFTAQLYNAGAGQAIIEMQTLAGDGNDSIVAFSNVGGGGAHSWSIGEDNSDGDKFKIEKSYRSLGNASNLYLECDPGNQTVRFAKPPRLPSFTVAGLPSAATAGAGAMVFCSNESGGAVPAFSDGTNWRRMTDRAIVS